MSASAHSPQSSSSRILATAPFDSASTTRLQALYSDFSRQKHSNPVSFQANVEWWRKALETVVATGLQKDPSSSASSSRLVLGANAKLMNAVKIPKVGKPLALGTALAELQTSNVFIPITDFMALKSSLYATRSLPIRVAAFVVGRPLWWALEQAGIVGDEGLLGLSTRDRHKGTGWYGDYVVVPLVEKAADAIIELQRETAGSPADDLYSWSSFSKTFASAVEGTSADQLYKDDLKVLLKHLERDRGVLVYDNNLVKFIDSSPESRAITAVDRGVLELKNAVESMHHQIDSLEQKVERCTREAASALKHNRKPIALNHIRLRKQYQELLTKRTNSLNTLESTLLTVEAALGDIEIMNSYETSTSTLKSILAHPSLQRENIDQTMEALADANADAREVDDAIKLGGEISIGNVEDEDVEEELANLVKEIEGVHIEPDQTESERRLLNLQVPQQLRQSKTQTPVLAG